MYILYVYMYAVCDVQITGWTALFFAVKSDNLALVRFLLNRGVDPTVKCKVRVHTGWGNL